MLPKKEVLHLTKEERIMDARVQAELVLRTIFEEPGVAKWRVDLSNWLNILDTLQR